MRKLIFLFTILFLFKSGINAQLFGNSTFTLEGKINIDTAKVLLIPVGEDIYYPKNRGFQESSIINGKFSFSGNILYPYAFRLMVRSNPGYISNIFLIDSGIQKINCHIDSLREIPDIKNTSIKEEKGIFFNTFFNINNELSNSISSKEYPTLIRKKDSLLLQYTKEHSNSYLALWTLVDKLSTGYEPIYDSINSQLSVNIKQTYTARILAGKLKASAILSIGKPFPQLILLNTKMQKQKLIINNSDRYTLIDFWFSHCSPCISQFNQLKSIFMKYKSKGFEIIGISTDLEKDTANWKKVIESYHIPWQQLLDLNGFESNKLSIQEFPTNFLLNKNGKIIIKNISPEELENFLTRVK